MNTGDTVRWFLFTASLPGKTQGTARVRTWRALKDLGAGLLRDGVSLLPATDAGRAQLEALCAQVETAGGSAWLLELPAQQRNVERGMRRIFNRDPEFAELGGETAVLASSLPRLDEATTRRELRRIEARFQAIARHDFFPGKSQARTRQALADLTARINRHFSPREPSPTDGKVERRAADAYSGRRWATRRHLWVDRVASAWLVRRFIDTEAEFAWIDRPDACPRDAVGFDFDGAEFTHIGDRVTFEVLLASFGLEDDAGLAGLGRLVHYLDVGGEPVAEASGFEAVLAGLRETSVDDDALLAATTPVLDALHHRFSNVTD